MSKSKSKLKEQKQPAGNKDRGSTAAGSAPENGLVARLLFTPIDITFLVYFRIAFGLLMLWLGWQYYQHGMIARYYIDPPTHFTYYGFGWVKPWPAIEMLGLTRGGVMYLHFFLLGVLAAFLAAGLFYRVSAVLFCLGFTYVFLLEQARYLNHYYLIVLISFLLIFIPAHRKISLDVLLKPALRSSTVPAWTLRVLQMQIICVYFFAGVAKCNLDWIQGEPMGSFLFARRFQFPESFEPIVTHPMTALVMSWAALVLDLVVFPMLLWRRTRLFSLLAAICFHLMNTQLFRIDIFPWFMLASSIILFFPDKLPGRNRDVPYFGTEQPAARNAGPISRADRRVAVAVCLYLAVQFLVPLRPLFYSGNTNWTNEGQQFSWRMLVRSKHVVLGDPPQFIARARKDGQVTEGPIAIDQTDPRFHRVAWAKHWQLSKVPRSPDLILQFAHWQAEKLRAQGYEDVEIRAWIPVSLNSRPAQPLVDPSVDLAQEPQRLLTPYPWVTRLETPLPPFETRRRHDEARYQQLHHWLDLFEQSLRGEKLPGERDVPD